MMTEPTCPICGESVADYKGPCPKPDRPLEEENRRLREALPWVQLWMKTGCPEAAKADVANRIAAALAAEPASGERETEMASILQGHQLMQEAAPPPSPMQGEEEMADDLLCKMDKLVRNEDYERNLIAAALRQRADEATRAFANWTDEHGNEWVALTAKGHADLNADLMEAMNMLDDARASLAEATRTENEACAKIADYGDDRFIAAAIRARITKGP